MELTVFKGASRFFVICDISDYWAPHTISKVEESKPEQGRVTYNNDTARLKTENGNLRTMLGKLIQCFIVCEMWTRLYIL